MVAGVIGTLRIVVVLLVAGVLSFDSSVFGTEVDVDPTKMQKQPLRLGVMVWSWYLDDPTRAARLLSQLPKSFKYVRWSPVLFSNSAPSGVSDADMDAFVAKSVLPDDGLSGVVTTAKGLQKLGITPLAMFWQPPSSYRFTWGGIQYFNSKYVNDYAMFIASCLKRMSDAGAAQPLLEVMNEPDGYWPSVSNTQPELFATLVAATQAAIVRRGLNCTLVGPSLSTLEVYPDGRGWASDNVDRYLSALQSAGVLKDLGGLSFHPYDRIYNPTQPAAFLDDIFTDLTTKVLPKYDPSHSKLRIMSEFTVETQYLDVADGTPQHFEHNAFDATCYPSVNATDMYADAEQLTAAWAVQVYTYVLQQINNGMDVAILWELYDRGGAQGDNKCFGMFDRQDRTKPMHEVLVQNLLAFVPDAEALLPVSRTWQTALAEKNASMALFKPVVNGATRGTELVIAVANTGRSDLPLTVKLPEGWKVVGARCFTGKTTNHNATAKAGSVSFTAPPYSAVTVYVTSATVSAVRQHVTGRSLPVGSGIAFDSPGVSVDFVVSRTRNAYLQLGNYLAPASAEPQHSYFITYVDNKLQDLTLSTEAIPNGTMATVRVATGLDPSLTHTVRVVKITEADWNAKSAAHPNYVVVGGISVDEGGTILPANRSQRRIEFIGDSITAGFCNLCPSQNSAAGESYALSWASLTCTSFGAECHTSAWSGFGVVENYNPTVDAVMPDIYRRTLATMSDTQWDFSTWVPDAVVVNLGTNDQLKRRPQNLPLFAAKYQELVRNISTAYGKAVHIFLACGPMDEAYCDPVMWAIGNTTDIHTHFLDHRGFLDGSHGPACCGHPSAQVDKAMAAATVKRIGAVMGWPPSP